MRATLLVLLLLAGRLPAQDQERHNVAILLYPGVELLDFAGPGEVFASAHNTNGQEFHVYTVAESAEPLLSQGFLRIVPEYTLDNCPQPEIIVLPGGNVPTERPHVVDWVRRYSATDGTTLSVCNGALLLAKGGLLDGMTATTHHSALETLRLAAPRTKVVDNERVVDNGKVVTAGGVSSGIDGALHLVARVLGQDTARDTARYMEYRWEPDRPLEPWAKSPPTEATRLDLVRVLMNQGQAAALAAWKGMSPAPSEQDVNIAGYQLLDIAPNVEPALAVFELNTAAFPESANAWDSLSDGYIAAGRKDDALRCSRRSLELLGHQPGVDAERLERIRMSAQGKVDFLQSHPGAAAVTQWVCRPCGGNCHDHIYSAPGQCEDCGMPLVPHGT